METPDSNPTFDSIPVGSTSLVSRLFNVFATPGDVFEEVKNSKPSLGNWLVPVILASLVGIISVWVMFSLPTIQQQVRNTQEKKFDEIARKQNMSPQQTEQFKEQMERFSGVTILKIGGTFGAVAGSFFWLFALALGIWLLGAKIFKGQFAYMQAVEVAGLGMMIGVLGGIVGLLLVVVKGSLFVSCGPALLISEFDPQNKVHLALGALNLFTFWNLGVISVGVSKLSGVSTTKAALWLFGVWAVIKGAFILSGIGAMGA
jgi:hypothetical protein